MDRRYCECYQMAVPCTSKCECMNCHNKGNKPQRNDDLKTLKALHQLLQTPTLSMADVTVESEEEDSDADPQRALDLEETLPTVTSDGVEDAATPTTTQGDLSMSSLHRSPARGLSRALPGLRGAQDTEYPIEMSVEGSFKLSVSADTVAFDLNHSGSRGRSTYSKSAILSADPVGAMLVNEASKFAAGGKDGAGEDMSQRNESIISMDSSMEGAISWNELDFCSSPSFMELDSHF
jgi:hypothetical protein